MAWYDYPTNYSTNQSVDGVADFFFNYPNIILNYWYNGGWVLFVWLFSFLALLAFGSRKALLVSSFACFILSTYLAIIGTSINFVIPITMMVLTIIGGIGAMAERRGY